MAKDRASKLQDQLWRLNNLYTIVDKDNNVIPFRMNGAQRKLYEDLWFRNSILKSRQHGFTTFIAILGLDNCLFKANLSAGFIAHGLNEAASIFDKKIKFAYEQLPQTIRNKVPLTSETKSGLSFANGSSVQVGTSMRSGTVQFLHVSEFGKIAATRPDKAREIKTGAFEAVPKSGVIFVESTAEGNEGAFYDLDKNARDFTGELTPLDFKPHFFAWFEDPNNRLSAPEDLRLTEHQFNYFEKLESEGIRLDPEQQFWYIKKADGLGEDMKREHPSTAAEAFAGSVEGALFSKEMAQMRLEDRITTVPHDPHLPVFTFWDLGYNDNMTIWFMQRVGTQDRYIRYYQNHLEEPSFYADYLHKLEREHRYSYMKHYMPHDVGSHVWQVGKSGIQVWRDLGISPIRKIDKAKSTAEVMAGVQAIRQVLSTAVIDEINCVDGIRALDNYIKEWDEKNSRWKDKPMHNWASDGVDALRTRAVGFRPEIGYMGNRRGKVVGATGLMGRTR